MLRRCWQYWLGTLIVVLGVSIASFAADAVGESGLVASRTYMTPDRIPIQIWKTGLGMDSQLSLMDKPKRIHMDSFDSDIGFRFQLAVAPIAIKAFYRLVGQDNDWQLLSGGMTTLSYSALPTGHYRLEVQLFTPQDKAGTVYSVANIWVAPAWGRTSGWIALASLVVVLCWGGVSSGILPGHRRRALLEIGQDSLGVVAQTSPQFLMRLTEECRTSLMLMASGGELQQTAPASRGFERLQGLLQQLHYFATNSATNLATNEPYVNQQVPIILRSWLLPRLEWYCCQAESEGLTLQILLIPDAVVTLDSQLLDEWLNALVSRARIAVQSAGNLSVMCMLEHDSGMLVFRVMYSGVHSPGCDLNDLQQDIAFDLLWCRLAQSGGRCQSLLDEDGKAGWELRLPSSWSLLQGISSEYQQISVPVSPSDAPQLLIVESDPDMSPLLLAWLGDEYRLLFSASVRGALERAQEETIDLILCTAHWLPDGESRELLSRVKEAAETNHIPFILCCASGSPDSEASAWDGLADDYLPLPLEPRMLRRRLQALLENRQRVRAWLKEHLIFGELNETLQSEAMALSRDEGLDRQFSDELYTRACQLLGQGAMSVETLADQMGLSSRTLQRKLQSLFGVNYSDYVRKIQMQLVVSQLQQGASVKMAARVAGFRDQAYLTRVFRQTFNMSPTEYRKRFTPSEDLT